MAQASSVTSYLEPSSLETSLHSPALPWTWALERNLVFVLLTPSPGFFQNPASGLPLLGPRGPSTSPGAPPSVSQALRAPDTRRASAAPALAAETGRVWSLGSGHAPLPSGSCPAAVLTAALAEGSYRTSASRPLQTPARSPGCSLKSTLARRPSRRPEHRPGLGEHRDPGVSQGTRPRYRCPVSAEHQKARNRSQREGQGLRKGGGEDSGGGGGGTPHPIPKDVASRGRGDRARLLLTHRVLSAGNASSHQAPQQRQLFLPVQ